MSISRCCREGCGISVTPVHDRNQKNVGFFDADSNDAMALRGMLCLDCTAEVVKLLETPKQTN